VDVVVAIAAFAIQTALLFGGGFGGHEHAHGADAAGVALAAASALPLVVWRRSPLAVFAITAVASTALNAIGYPPGPPLGPTIALYHVAETRVAPLRRVAAVVGPLFLLHVAAAGIGSDAFPASELAFGVLVWGGAWAAGDRTRLRRERMAELEERAVRAEREAERDRRLAAAEERTRIARDLHDSAGHAINVVLVQAGAARLLQEQDPERSRAALETIEDVARDTLGEIDRLVRALRDDDGSGVEPPRGVGALETLVQQHRAAGIAVDVEVSGQPRRLAPRVDQAAYRILQEALTNAARHGDGDVRVSLAYRAKELAIGVANRTAMPVGGGGGGHGLVGMCERAALVGGSVDVDGANGWFTLRARLPYGDGS
jgi:signal transduction histidine kinase